jgi:hypothetical protein
MPSEEEMRRELERRRLARQRLIPFCEYMWPPDPKNNLGFITRPHRELIAGALEWLESRKINRLMIFVPSQYGKSEIFSRAYPAWYFGRNPNHLQILISHTADLAYNLSYEARSKIQEPAFGRVFGEKGNFSTVDTPGFAPVRISGKVASTREWRLAPPHRGRMKATGVSGAIAGYGAHQILVDDPVSDIKDMESEKTRASHIRWFRTSLFNRISPDGAIAITMCLVGDTNVLMGDGTWRKLASACEGDRVMTWNKGKHEPKVVQHFIPQGKAPIYRLRTGNHTVRGTGNHPVLVFDGEYRYVEMADLKRGDMVVTSHSWESLAPDPGITVEDAWALGFMYGDGWVTRRPNAKGSMGWVTCFARGVHEEVNDRALDYFTEKFGKAPKETKYGYYRTEISAAGRWFEGLGLGFGKTAKTKRIPDDVFLWPLDRRRAFIQGYSDADGCYDRHQRCNIRSANSGLLTDAKLLAQSCGYRVTNLTMQTRLYDPPHSPEPIWATSWAMGFSVVNFEDAPFALTRVTSVELEDEEEEVFDLSVEGNENFIADGVVVHNTRWDENDICGWLLKEQANGGELYYVLRLPAVAESPEQTRVWAERNNVSKERFIVSDMVSRNNRGYS